MLYAKWFESPIPPRGISLNLPMSDLLSQPIQFPNDDPAEAYFAPE